MARLTILDPTAPPPDVDAHPGPPMGRVDGASVAIRYDLTWRSFDWVRDEWARLFEAEGAQVSQWCAGDRTGEAAEATLVDWKGVLADREVAISGLGN